VPGSAAVVGLIPVACDIFSFVFVIFLGQGIVFYETDKRKIKENHEILAYKL
jgi:formate hydrogenlyase subunit 3/multisubunit Na+/H+ antiporter MnhD subunit